MTQQLELFHDTDIIVTNRITLSHALSLLWDLRLKNKPSGRSFMGNRKALCKTFGHKYLDQIFDVDFENHREIRLRKVGIGTVFHDHTLLSLVYNCFRKWKRRNLVHNGVKFGLLMLPIDNPTMGIKKIKPAKRRRIVTPNEFSRLIEHADHDLANLLLVLLDTGIRLGDALMLKSSNYATGTNTLSWVQNKTKKENSLPLDNRCRSIYLKAIKDRREYLFNSINLRARFEGAMKRARLSGIQMGRDFRKTNYNVIRKASHGPDIPRQIMGHTSNRTGDDHYFVEQRDNLLPFIKKIEHLYQAKII